MATRKPTWTRLDERRAIAEGWNIFSTFGGHELQRIDCPDGPPEPEGPYDGCVFEDDGHAWIWVMLTHSPLHQRALAFLKKESPGEYDKIIDYVIHKP